MGTARLRKGTTFCTGSLTMPGPLCSISFILHDKPVRSVSSSPFPEEEAKAQPSKVTGPRSCSWRREQDSHLALLGFGGLPS